MLLVQLMTEMEIIPEIGPRSFAAKANIPSFLEKKICVVLTAYNDQESIGPAVKEFISQRNVVEVIVVDNNSNDETRSRATIEGAKVYTENSQGYGYACIRGLREALLCSNCEVVVLAEGDMTFRGRDIWKLLPFLEDADFVLGSRTHMTFTESDSQLDWFNIWGNLLVAKLLQFRFFNLKFLGKVRLTDVGCTFRAIKRQALARIIDKLSIGGNHFSPHMTRIALENGLKVIEVPVTFRKRMGQSKGAGASRQSALRIATKMVLKAIV